MADVHERLRKARERAGYATAKDASDRLAVPYGTYSGHESGSRGIKDKDLARYAKVYKVSIAWLKFGVAGGPVPIEGYVGAGGSVDFSNGQGPFGMADRPPDLSEDGVALIVRGDSMPGVAEDGWLIYYENRREPVTTDLIGHHCVCELPDGRVLVKKLFSGSLPGTWTLASVLGAPIQDVELVWAAKVAWIKPQ